jgi:DNA-directed RNA polymerase specialized sigma24 family protein
VTVADAMSIRDRYGGVTAVWEWLRALLRRRGSAPEGPGGQEDVLARIDGQHRVLKAMRDLPEPYRSVLFHAEVDGLTLEEIARRLGTPVGTVAGSLRHAQRLLRESLANRAP